MYSSFKKGGYDSFAKWRNLKSERLSRTKGMPPKEIHEDFMESLGKESPSYTGLRLYDALT